MVQKIALPNGLKLFIADAIDKTTKKRFRWFVVGKNEDSAFLKWAEFEDDKIMKYDFTFDEVLDEEIIKNFRQKYGIRVGVYVAK